MPRDTPSRVLLLGDINVDLSLDIPGFPRPGGDAIASGQRVGLGGSAANTAVLVQRLGLQSALLSCVGSDSWSQVALDALAEEGVGLSHVVRHPSEPTSLNVVAVTPDGERTMFAYRGASAWYAPEDLPEAPIRRTEHVHLSGYAVLAQPQLEAARQAVRLARAAGCTVSLDVPVDPARTVPDELRRLLPDVDLLVIGMPEAAALVAPGTPADMARALRAAGAGLVALKLGAEGCLLHDASGTVTVEGIAVDSVDTTGAGDAFCAGALVAVMAGCSLEAVGGLANVAGAAAVGRRGAGSEMPTRADVTSLVPRLPPSIRDAVHTVIGCPPDVSRMQVSADPREHGRGERRPEDSAAVTGHGDHPRPPQGFSTTHSE